MNNYRHLQHILIGNKSITDRGITFINDAEHEDFMSYSELYKRSVRLLNGLRHAGVKAGHELLFQIDDNRTFIELFWASMLGQMIPVPVTMGVNEESTLKVYKVWNKLNDPYLLCQGDVLEGLSDYVLDKPEWTLQLQEMRSRSLNPEQLMSEGEAMIAEAESESELELDPEQMAFIQFSSGSTGDPKGVILTHSNVITNVRATVESWDLDVIKAALSWIPLTHDMGLISMHILNAYIQINQYIMPSKLFIRNPILWLDKAHEHRISVLYCPNFGYKYLLAYYEQEQDYEWDLSNIQYICNGAEPISTELASRFMSQLAPYHLKSTAMKAVYGLAEGTVCVSVTPRDQELKVVALDHRLLQVGERVKLAQSADEHKLLYADVGYAVSSCQIKITDRSGRTLDDYTFGNILIKGPSVTQGYYNDEEKTKQVIDEDGWLNTGDLGFMHKGRLVVVGRSKDVIFVNGQNVFSHDIERVAEEVEGVELWNVAACGVRNRSRDSEEVLVFLRYKGNNLKEFSVLADRVARHIQHKFGIFVDHVLPVSTIPKTTSGKLQRYKLEEQYTNGRFAASIAALNRMMLESLPDRPEHTDIKLSRLCEDVLGKPIGIHDHFNDMGGNSLILTRITDELYRRYGIELVVADLFKYPTIAQLTAYIDRGASPPLPSIGLPDHYRAAGDRTGATFEAEVEAGACLALRELAAAVAVNMEDVLLSMFMYVLKELSGESFIQIQIATEDDQFHMIGIDFTAIDTLESLLRAVNSKLAPTGEGLRQYSMKDFAHIQRDVNDKRMIPLVTKYSIATMKQKLLGIFDMIIVMVEVEDRIELICEFNHHRLNTQRLKELFTQYVNVLTDIAVHANG